MPCKGVRVSDLRLGVPSSGFCLGLGSSFEGLQGGEQHIYTYILLWLVSVWRERRKNYKTDLHPESTVCCLGPPPKRLTPQKIGFVLFHIESPKKYK